MTRGRKPTPEGAEIASGVLSDLAAGLSQRVTAERHGVSQQRVSAIARAAKVTTRASRGGAGYHQGAAILARLRELAAKAGEDPDDYLEDAARCRAACEAIVALLDERVDREESQMAMIRLAEDVKRLAIGHNPPELAAQVRAVVEAAGDER